MPKTIQVTGMSCGGCESAVENALSSVDGVENVEADHETDSVLIEGTAERTTLVQAVEDAGYEASA